jgi:hypothetical protein
LGPLGRYCNSNSSMTRQSVCLFLFWGKSDILFTPTSREANKKLQAFTNLPLHALSLSNHTVNKILFFKNTPERQSTKF